MKRPAKCILVLAGIGIVIAGWLLACRPKPFVDISFLGYTTQPDGSISAKCQVRNLTDGPMVVLTLSPQLHSAGGGQWSQPSKPVVATKTLITAGRVANVDFPPPNGSATWRAAVIARSHRQELIEVKIRHLLPRRILPRFQPFGQHAYSLAIPPPVEPYQRYTPPEKPPEPAIPAD